MVYASFIVTLGSAYKVGKEGRKQKTAKKMKKENTKIETRHEKDKIKRQNRCKNGHGCSVRNGNPRHVSTTGLLMRMRLIQSPTTLIVASVVSLLSS